MSPLNPFPARPTTRPAAQPQQDRVQSGWGGQQAPAEAGPHVPWPQQQGYPQQGYAQPTAAPQADPYAPQFEPYVPQRGGYAQQPAYQAPQQQPAQAPAPQYQQPHAAAAPAYGSPQQPAYNYGGAQPAPQQQHWAQQHAAPQQAPVADPHGFDVGSYSGYGQPQGYAQEYEQNAQDWHQTGAAGGYAHDPYQQQGAGADIGFAQAAGGELDAGYGDEEGEYEEEAPRSGPRYMMMAAALAGAIIVGGGMAYSYRAIFGTGGGEPPVIKSASAPSKTKPADAGGKTFDYADRKIMGRLGEGSAAGGATAAGTAEAAADENGTRKVSTLVVGRDGSIQAPPVEAAPDAGGVPGTSVAVPGMTVIDAFGASAKQAAAAPPAVSQPEPEPSQKIAVAPPVSVPVAKEPVAVKTVNAAAETMPTAPTGSVKPAGEDVVQEAASEPAPKPVKKVKVASAAKVDDAYDAAAAPPVTTSGGSSGFVAVLASVPRSTSSRMDALKRFADLQQKYGTVLAGKTPDVAEANLGAKGNYHRLVVGPPASREQASSVCTQLKGEGYGDCWVTPY